MKRLNGMIDKVLLIDDDADDRLFFAKALKQVAPQTQLKTATRYDEVTQVLATYLPDIIFIDINMPGRNGFQCLEALMANKLFRTIPVIMHSSSSNPSHIALAYSYGANLYFKSHRTMKYW